MKTIKLTQGKLALVDDADYEWLNSYKWYADRRREAFYVRREAKGITYMHRLIMNPPKGMTVDHIDGNGLNNQRANLRICTMLENMRNRSKYRTNKSGYKGVSFNNRTKKWYAQISVNNKGISLGLFPTPLEASKAYISACEKLHGKFANYNHPRT